MMMTRWLCVLNVGFVLFLPLCNVRADGVQTDKNLADNEIEKFVDNLVNKGYKHIAVLPKVIVKKSKGKVDTHGSASTGKLGPRTDKYVIEMREALGIALNKKDGKVISQSDTEYKIQETGFNSDDLNDEAKVKQLSEAMDVDAIVYLEYIYNNRRSDQIGVAKKDRVRLKFLGAGLERGESKKVFEADVSLSEAAYSGDNWWIREWKGDRLVSRELINSVVESGNQIGTGQEWERVQFTGLYRAKSVHPAEIDEFPYQVRFKVRNSSTGKYEYREPTKFGKEFVVGLNDGEEYALEVANDTDRHVRMALFIDGASNIDGHYEKNVERPIKKFPHELKPNQIYRFGPGNWDIKYWKTSDSGQLSNFALFEAKTLTDPQKIGSSFLNNVGMITVVFYADGRGGMMEPKKNLKQIDDHFNRNTRRSISITPGLFSEMKKINPSIAKTSESKELGVIMAAMTFYYRPTEYIAKAKKDGHLDSNDPVSEFTHLVSKRRK